VSPFPVRENDMTILVTPQQIRNYMAQHLDEPAEGCLPEGSLALARYRRGLAYVDCPHAAADADAGECREYGLTGEQWSQQVEAARIALHHDMKLHAVQQGAGHI
jgi:hypothetical protein